MSCHSTGIPYGVAPSDLEVDVHARGGNVCAGYCYPISPLQGIAAGVIAADTDPITGVAYVVSLLPGYPGSVWAMAKGGVGVASSDAYAGMVAIAMEDVLDEKKGKFKIRGLVRALVRESADASITLGIGSRCCSCYGCGRSDSIRWPHVGRKRVKRKCPPFDSCVDACQLRRLARLWCRERDRMTILASELISATEHRIGGPVSDKFTNTLAVVNRACGMFFTMHPWRTALVGESLLDTVASVGTISLPTNFASLMGVARTDGGLITQTTLPRLIEMRRAGQDALGVVTMVAVEGVGTLHVYQTPSATESDVISITYRSKWTNVIAVSDTIAVADFAEPLLIECCRGYAAGLESGDTLGFWEQLKKSSLFMECAAMDGGGSPILDRGGMPYVPLSTDAFWVYGGIS
jgi:hypothetical protein